MWSAIIWGLRIAASACAGWVISDIFNEKKDAESKGTTRTFSNIFSRNWIKWLVIGVGMILGFVLVFFVIPERKKRK